MAGTRGLIVDMNWWNRAGMQGCDGHRGGGCTTGCIGNNNGVGAVGQGGAVFGVTGAGNICPVIRVRTRSACSGKNDGAICGIGTGFVGKYRTQNYTAALGDGFRKLGGTSL